MSDCPVCGKGFLTDDSLCMTISHFACVEKAVATGQFDWDLLMREAQALRVKFRRAEAELRELKARTCETCKHCGSANPKGWDGTLEKNGYAACQRVVFNPHAFWTEDYDERPKDELPAAWVIDGSDYKATLYVTARFRCSEWEARICDRLAAAGHRGDE